MLGSWQVAAHRVADSNSRRFYSGTRQEKYICLNGECFRQLVYVAYIDTLKRKKRHVQCSCISDNAISNDQWYVLTHECTCASQVGNLGNVHITKTETNQDKLSIFFIYLLSFCLKCFCLFS